jgi:beta-lactam-binding protein with PASTA domain
MSAAKRSITSHDCTVGRIKKEFSSRIKRNHVISQQPRPGRRLRLGAKVRLVVSRGP